MLPGKGAFLLPRILLLPDCKLPEYQGYFGSEFIPRPIFSFKGIVILDE